MARKKKIEPIVGIGKDPENKLKVQKAHALAALWQSDLSLAEFKIMDAYLARIDSRKPEMRTVQLTKGELEAALGVKRINHDDLEQRLKNLYSPINLEKGNPKKIKLRALFEEADAEQDEDGIWKVQLTCTTAAMKYMFNVEQIGYFRYKLRSVTSITSRYSYILFVYLESNRFRGTWEIDLDEIRQILNCDKDASYDEFKIFNNRILKKCQKEILEKTECRFTYEPIRKGRPVAAIRFTLESLAPKIEEELGNGAPDEPEQLTIDDHEFRTRREAICCGFDDKIFDEFSDEELIEFRALAWGKEDPDEADSQYSLLHDRKIATEMAVSKLIREKILAMNAYSQRDPVKNRYTYLKAALVKHVPKPKAKKSQGSFDTDEFFALAVKRSFGDDFDPEILENFENKE